MTANGCPVCSDMNIKVELSSGRSRSGKFIWDTSLPGTDPQVTLNVVAFTVTFPTPELAWRTSKMVGPVNPGGLNSSLDKKGSTVAVSVT